ncbi:LapA family protein [Haloechinothrix halophila]|uniref:LapA family protein n=1 Tax=Haloechinothrix halophila TaxID=1069073 RepID=UPI0003FD8638|nr:lipopolysaccharide assembly protein LapA domain-containing protein [Haloechinothrix halophila]
MSKDNETRADTPGKTGAEHTEPRTTEPTTPAEKTARPGGPDTGGPAKLMPTRISGAWIAVIVAVIVLVFLLIFILQNSASVTVHYLGASGTLPLGIALLFAAVGGALLVALVGVARMFQLRRFARRAGRGNG